MPDNDDDDDDRWSDDVSCYHIHHHCCVAAASHCTRSDRYVHPSCGDDDEIIWVKVLWHKDIHTLRSIGFVFVFVLFVRAKGTAKVLFAGHGSTFFRPRLTRHCDTTTGQSLDWDVSVHGS